MIHGSVRADSSSTNASSSGGSGGSSGGGGGGITNNAAVTSNALTKIIQFRNEEGDVVDAIYARLGSMTYDGEMRTPFPHNQPFYRTTYHDARLVSIGFSRVLSCVIDRYTSIPTRVHLNTYEPPFSRSDKVANCFFKPVVVAVRDVLLGRLIKVFLYNPNAPLNVAQEKTPDAAANDTAPNIKDFRIIYPENGMYTESSPTEDISNSNGAESCQII